MVSPAEIHLKMTSAYQLLQGADISVSTFEQIHTLLKGIHPELDKKLAICSQALAHVNKLQTGDIITLTAEGLSEDTEDKKKRKRALLLFISSYKNLRHEIKRIDAEVTLSDISRARQLLQWQPTITIEQGIREMMGHPLCPA